MLVKLGAREAAAQEPSLVGLLASCHEKIRAFSALAVSLASRDDLGAEEVSDACSRCERYFADALPLHVADEDQSLRPRLASASGAVGEALEAMSAEHVEHRASLDALIEALAAMREHGSTPATRAALARVAPAFERAMAEHLALEESRIFPAISRFLSADEQAAIVVELRARRTKAR
ncbi:MAG: hemerythrin domain-containing protein [Myxococcales bacterium]|nr:hemerythrin domain-containing protein [Myxococcales bacterium]